MCPMSKLLIKLSLNCNVILGGLQATSFFYPLVNFTQSAWDFYYDSREESFQIFIDGINQITMHDVLQDTKNAGYRIFHMRGSVNGSYHPIDGCIYCRPVDPYTSLLLLPFSHQHSMLTSY